MKTKIYIIVLSVASMLYGCTKDFDSMNVNPALPTPETVEPSNQLTYLEKWGSFGNADLHERIHNLYVDMFAQYYAETWFTSGNYVMNDGWQQDYWPQFWSWINNANMIIENTTDPNKINVVQIARIWKVYMFHRATDLFGDLPYFNAANGSGDVPAYDSQELIYKDMLNELKDAVSLLDESKEPLYPTLATNDIIYQGSTAMWKKFGNSLRLRLAMRLTEVDATLAQTNAEEAVAGGVFVAGDKYPGIPSSTTEWGMEYPIPMYVSWGDLCLTESMHNILSGLGGVADTTYTSGAGDPRGTKFFTLFENRLKPMKVGLSFASRATDAANMSKFSKPNVVTFDKSRSLCLFPVNEAYFLRAEGAARGWNMGTDAKTLYEAGISSAMSDLGVDGAIITSYTASNSANENGVSVVWNEGATLDQKLDKIITQKYIGGFPDNSWEAWADHRRLLKPYLVPVEDPMGSGVTPYVSGAVSHENYIERILYPSTEAVDDPIEYAKVKDKDFISTPVWWTGR